MANYKGRIPVDPEIRFLNKVNKTDYCWLWEGSKHSNKGYGNFFNGKKNIKAHRFAYQHFVGEIADNLCVLHRCDNPSCVRPDHLFLGTNQDNVDDKLSKNRHPRGSESGNNILSDEDVIEIKKALRCFSYCGQNNHLAKIYGVNHRTISNIKNNRSWSHIKIA